MADTKAGKADEKAGEGKQAIEIVCRIRPSKKQVPCYDIVPSEGRLHFKIPKNLQVGEINNTREEYDFFFNQILDTNTTQEEVFERLAQKSIDSVLEGINSTIFAYGQTGSGKTFTITGGAERYQDRGLIPRTISYIFSQFAKRPEREWTCRISYLEIYNNGGYDLLYKGEDMNCSLEELPKVRCMEDDDGEFVLQNLSRVVSSSEEDALNLLFLGDTNRTIAETPMNMASSRSHCIFTIYVESCLPGSAVIRKSKLNLVDLAGSERVGKTGVKQKLLTEAVAINSALFFLEQVIVALGERAKGKRTHIPYRNSMMTSVLKDSLGGNCKTLMVATMSSEANFLDESISTCRFAQRVGLVANEVRVNEEVDPQVMIRKLKKENAELKEQISLLQGNDVPGARVSPEDRERVIELVKAYIAAHEDPNSQLIVGDVNRIQCAFSVMRAMLLEGGGPAPAAAAEGAVDPAAAAGYADQLKKVQLQIQQRDNEINILVGMLKKKRPPCGEASTQTGAKAPSESEGTHTIEARQYNSEASGSNDPRESILSPQRQQHLLAVNEVQSDFQPQPAAPVPLEVLSDMEMLKDRNKAFEAFRKSYRKNEVIESQKQILREKFGMAKATGEAVNAARARINSIKARIEQRRVELDMQHGGAEELPEDPEELALRGELDQEKKKYKTNFDALKHLKAEIEHIQHLMEGARVRLQHDFESWFDSKAGQVKYEMAQEKKAAARHAQQGAPAEMQAVALPTQQIGMASTGDSAADADIAAFYKAREELMKSQAR